jgi:dihydrodipicolinate synthase/N-acetylneuraminate lyase
MNKEKQIKGGVVVPLVTPVNVKGDIDFNGLEKFVDWIANQGINGLFIAGTTGRFSYFSPEQNADVCRVVSDVAGERVTIYGGCCDSGLHRILANTVRMKRAGADIAVVTAPYYLSYSIEEVEKDLEKVADESSLPIIYYNIPEFVGYGLRSQWIGEIAHHSNVVGYKDSSNDFIHFIEVLKFTENMDFNVLIGKELLLAKALKAGAAGMVISFANAFPEIFVGMMKSAKEKNWEIVEKYQLQAAKIIENFEHYREKPVFSSLMYYIEEALKDKEINIKLF